MNFRTDLAIEAREFLTEKEIPGITSQDSQIGNVQVSTIQVHSQEAAHRLHKPIGTTSPLQWRPFPPRLPRLTTLWRPSVPPCGGFCGGGA